MRYFLSHHQHKGSEIDKALKQNGWLFRHKHVAIALFDHTINRARPEDGRALLQSYYDKGSTIITYPHGATGSWWMDSGLYNGLDKLIAGNLVIGEGHVHVEQIIQPTLMHYAIGWNYCPILSFKKPKILKNILFAPIHGTQKTNELREEAVETNARVYRSLLEFSDKYKIYVRCLNPMDSIGLWRNNAVRIKYAKPDGFYDDIDNADLVIAEGTFMYISVARGKPTIGLNQFIPPRPNHVLNKEFCLKNWDEWGPYMAYPLDFDSKELGDLIDEAINVEQINWKKLFIGSEMDKIYLSNLLKEIRQKDIDIRSNKNG